MISRSVVQQLALKYGVDTSVVPIATLKKAIEVEMEHRDRFGDSPENALVIALAHLQESPRYYKMLARLERKEEKYWATRAKPSIFLD